MKRVMKTIVLILLAIQVFSCASASEKKEAERIRQQKLEQQKLEQEQNRVAWLVERANVIRREQEEFDRQKAEIDRQNEEAQAKYVTEFVENWKSNWKSKYAAIQSWWGGWYYYEKMPGINFSEIYNIANMNSINNPYNFDRDRFYYIPLEDVEVRQWLGSNSIMCCIGEQRVHLHWTDSSLTKMIDGENHLNCLFLYEGVYEYETVLHKIERVPQFKMIKIDYISNSDIKKWAIEDYEKNSTPKTVPALKKTEFPEQLLTGFVFVKGNDKIKDFYIDECEVTQALYKAVMGRNPSEFAGSANPVEMVSWYDAVKFCNKLSEMSGFEKCYSGSGSNIKCDFSRNGYRLPTEAEWEYAAKGGDKSEGFKYSGSDDIDEVAWHYDNLGNETHPVKSKKPNELGLYDMSGNVWEWCWDWCDSDGIKPPYGSASGSYRVDRGGSWYNNADNCSVSSRDCGDPSRTSSDLGFRLARSAQD